LQEQGTVAIYTTSSTFLEHEISLKQVHYDAKAFPL
jgi:hypothetical protein